MDFKTKRSLCLVVFSYINFSDTVYAEATFIVEQSLLKFLGLGLQFYACITETIFLARLKPINKRGFELKSMRQEINNTNFKP